MDGSFGPHWDGDPDLQRMEVIPRQVFHCVTQAFGDKASQGFANGNWADISVPFWEGMEGGSCEIRARFEEPAQQPRDEPQRLSESTPHHNGPSGELLEGGRCEDRWAQQLCLGESRGQHWKQRGW